MPSPTDTARLVREARVRCGLTQSDFAERLGVSRKSVHFWETGVTTPSEQQMAAIAELARADDGSAGTT